MTKVNVHFLKVVRSLFLKEKLKEKLCEHWNVKAKVKAKPTAFLSKMKSMTKLMGMKPMASQKTGKEKNRA